MFSGNAKVVCLRSSGFPPHPVFARLVPGNPVITLSDPDPRPVILAAPVLLPSVGTLGRRGSSKKEYGVVIKRYD